MSPVTTSQNFQDFQPLEDIALQTLKTVFSLGDSDPRWPVGPGAENSLRLHRALDIVAQNWGLSPTSITVLSDRYLAFYLAIMGVPEIESLGFSPIEKKEILAIIDGLPEAISREEYEVGTDGIFDFGTNLSSLNIFQLRNGETGISQERVPKGNLIIDATSARPSDLTRIKLQLIPWRSLVLDATSWGGPRGVYFLAVNPEFEWRNPLPTLDTALPTFGANYALTLLATLALEDFVSQDADAIARANQSVRKSLAAFPDVDIAGTETGDRLSLSFLYVQSEELQRALWGEGFLVDSGSACSASALEPSHVLTRMGLLSHGNVRLRFTPANLSSVEALTEALMRHVQSQRN